MTVALPKLLAEWAEIIGEDLAVRVAMDLGGQEISIAARPGPENRLAKAIGHDAAVKIAREWGVGNVEIPLGPRSRIARIRMMLAAGLSRNEIAAAVGCSVRTVSNHAAAMAGDDDRQMALPLDAPKLP